MQNSPEVFRSPMRMLRPQNPQRQTQMNGANRQGSSGNDSNTSGTPNDNNAPGEGEGFRRGFVPGARIAVAVSGQGRSLENLLHWQKTRKSWPARIAGVIASRPCGGSAFATRKEIPLFMGDFSSEGFADTTSELRTWLARHKIDAIVLTGFLRPFPLTEQWDRKIINIHPALLPDYGGKGMYGQHVHKAVLTDGQKESGATIHFVDGNYDEGAIITQIHVPISCNETPDSLAAKVFEREKLLLPLTIQELCTGNLPAQTSEPNH